MITQYRFSSRVAHFEKLFAAKWGMNSYMNCQEPCVFIGLYDDTDFNIIRKHSGFKVLWQTGTPDVKRNNEYIRALAPDTVFINRFYCHFPQGANVKNVHIAIKDYSEFTPNIMGDKIYIYLGAGSSRNLYGYRQAEELKKLVKYDILYGLAGKNIDYKKEYYDKCFANLNLSLSGRCGFTTAFELGYMGRMSLTTSNAQYPMLRRGNMVDMINEESHKIGTIQPSMMDGFQITDDRWKKISFWQ